MTTKEKLHERIERERREMRLRPWEFSPSQVDEEPNPYPPGSMGFQSWEKAVQWRREIRERDPNYFDD
jgi:hypothetical protein